MFFGSDGSNLPPEMEQALRHQMEQAEMSADVTRHSVIRLFEELNVEQLVTFRMLLHHCAGEESGRYASHLEGFISGILQFKHGLCTGCGDKHDDASSLMPDEAVAPIVIEEGVQLEFTITKEAYDEKLLEYLVRRPTDRDVSNGLIWSEGENPVLCELCGFLSQSLEDRMLRKPGVDGCAGCQHKAAHG